MNTRKQVTFNSKNNFAARMVWMGLAMAVLLIASVSPVAAQSRESRDIDHPVRLTFSELVRPIAGDREIFYTFNAGPGELTMTLDLLQKSFGATVEVILYDKNAKQLFSFYAWALAQNAREIRRIKFPAPQQVVMKISVTHSKENYEGNFRLRLAGATSLPQSAAAAESSFGSAVPASPALALNGVMHVVMKDGSTQDIDLRRVQRITLLPAN